MRKKCIWTTTGNSSKTHWNALKKSAFINASGTDLDCVLWCEPVLNVFLIYRRQIWILDFTGCILIRDPNTCQ